MHLCVARTGVEAVLVCSFLVKIGEKFLVVDTTNKLRKTAGVFSELSQVLKVKV